MQKCNYFHTAYNILFKVLKDGAYLQIELNNALNINDEESKIITKIVYGVVQHNLELDNIISILALKKPKLSADIMLKIGIYCLLFLNSVPDYAVCNEITELTKTLGKQGMSGFINAVLKKVCSNKNAYLFPTEDENTTVQTHLSTKYSYPEWIIEKLLKAYPTDFLEKILERGEHKTHIRVNKFKITALEFEKLLNSNHIPFEKSNVNGYYVNYRQIKEHQDFNPLYTVQSAGSMTVCHTLNIKSGEKVLDVCAAPGGKSVYLSELGAVVTAWDIYEHRVNLINSYCKRMNANVYAVVKDATKYDENYKEKFDCVLTDVPCSGLGVAGKKADILLNRNAESIDELTALQASIMNTASKYVKTGGCLLYSTCTILPQENEDIVDTFLSRHLDFKAENISVFKKVLYVKDLSLKKEIRGEPYLQLFANIDSDEGFFMARLRKL
ncbi:MAG: 16S rRNA (cytosine(967)-C(5))-methyltransferase RsmB [Clostridia bacterium]|nr:16S rRNA (cytosine(967)-C(5))-methyltransferase RsmB [Clostridia bacterium]